MLLMLLVVVGFDVGLFLLMELLMLKVEIRFRRCSAIEFRQRFGFNGHIGVLCCIQRLTVTMTVDLNCIAIDMMDAIVIVIFIV